MGFSIAFYLMEQKALFARILDLATLEMDGMYLFHNYKYNTT